MANQANTNKVNEKEKIQVIEIKKPRNKPIMSLTTQKLPQSKLFNKTKYFLQELKQSNLELQDKMDKMGKQSVIIERNGKNENKESYVDLDLLLGVFEDKKQTQQSQTESVQSTMDKLLGITAKQNKKSIIIEEQDDIYSDDQDIDLD